MLIAMYITSCFDTRQKKIKLWDCKWIMFGEVNCFFWDSWLIVNMVLFYTCAGAVESSNPKMEM